MVYQEPSEELDDLAHRVIGAAIEVHRELGPGFLESTYDSAPAIELKLRGINFSRQHPVGLIYKGHVVGEGRLDFLVEQVLILELKAVDRLLSVQEAQVISYLKATKLTLGLLINFNVPILKHGIRRIVLSSK